MIAGNELLPVMEPCSTNPANEIASRLTGRDYISWSAISTFRTCPLKYKFRYIDGLPEESVSAALIFGTGIHSAVEQHFQATLSGEEQTDVERLMFAYRSAWLLHDPEAIQFGSTGIRASLDSPAWRMLIVFLASPAASVQGRVPGVEEEIRDMQVEDSGGQLLLNSHLASEISPGKKITTRFLVLTKTKEPGGMQGVGGVIARDADCSGNFGVDTSWQSYLRLRAQHQAGQVTLPA